MASERSNSDEKVYQFVSDPGHKETLSGRVRAACLTCRKKKMKCSGEIPCITCVEKGLACEGFVARKRPGRSAQQSPKVRTRTPSYAAASSSGAPQSTHQSDRRQSTESGILEYSNLRRIQTNSSDHYTREGGSNASTTEQSGSDMRSGNTAYLLSPSPADYYNSAPGSPITRQDWDYTGAHFTQRDPEESLPASASSQTTHASQLLLAARALEEQAQKLRQLALQEAEAGVDDAGPQIGALQPNPANLDSTLQSGHPAPYLQNASEVMSLQFAGYNPESSFGHAAIAGEYSVWQGPNTAVSTMTSFEQRAPASRQNSVYMLPPPADPSEPQWQGWQNQPQNVSVPNTAVQVQWQAIRETKADSQVSHPDLGAFSNQHATAPDSPYPWKPFDGT